MTVSCGAAAAVLEVSFGTCCTGSGVCSVVDCAQMGKLSRCSYTHLGCTMVAYSLHIHLGSAWLL
jgi:hypothetical protein